ncbi:MAG: FtsK/SpoIIIE domain-containing protein [Planctomycetales bacterium]
MISIQLGRDAAGRRLVVPPELFRTHFHLVGATGTGKSTALQTLLQPLLMQPGVDRCCLFLIDPIGNLSQDLLDFIAHPTLCPDHVRRRLVYVEPADEQYVLPFNPLTHTSEANRYYQTMRSVDIVLRAWAAQDVSQQPRLLQWTYKAFCAAAMLGLPIAMCRYLLHPGTPEHQAILARIPGEIRYHWQEILNARGSEATRILESTRNRLDPFFESVNLRRMFGTQTSRFDCERFIRERKIVVLNLGKYGKVPGFIADTIGGLVLNEIVETANRLSTNEGRQVVDPTFVVMDEFQKYVGVDIEDALPTVRQMGLRLILAHQSFSQLEREDVDLSQMIWQARSRLIFANSARDADILSEELAKLTFDPLRIKDQRTSLKQLIVGYRKEWLLSESATRTRSNASMEQEALGYNQSRSRQERPRQIEPSQTSSSGDSQTRSNARTSAASDARTSGRSQANVPIHDTFREVTNVTYQSFEEWDIAWGQKIRRLGTGEAICLLANDPQVREVRIDYHPIEPTRELLRRKDELLARNFASEFFLTAGEADREADACRRMLLTAPPIVIDRPHRLAESDAAPAADGSPFR